MFYKKVLDSAFFGCYSICYREGKVPSQGSREHEMIYGITARVSEIENGFGIEFVDMFGKHFDLLKKSNGEFKVWRKREQAEKALESNASRNGWIVA